MFSKSLFTVLALLVSFGVFVGCSESEDGNPVGNAPGEASIRVLHTSYDAPAVDVKVDGNTAFSSLGYGSSSGYASLDAGSYNVSVTPAGENSPVVIDADVTLEDGKEYTVIAAGDLANITPIVVEDMRSPVADMAKIRFAHMSPDAPSVDIKLDTGKGTTVFDNADFKSVTEYTMVGGGTYTFAVTPAEFDR